MMQYLEQPFFDDLRTRQQLGYVVSSAGSNQKDVIGSVFLVQSPSRSAEYLNNALNQFLFDAAESIEAMSELEFKIQAQVLRQGLQVRETSLGDQVAREWGEIESQRYEFDRVDRALQVLETITKDHLVSHFQKVFFSNETARVDIEILSPGMQLEQQKYTAIISDDEIFNERVLVNQTMV